MDRRRFVSKLNGLSKLACKKLIVSAGLKSKDERVLLAWYVEECNIHQVAANEHMQIESAYNSIALARNRLFNILTQQANLLPENVQEIIKYFL